MVKIKKSWPLIIILLFFSFWLWWNKPQDNEVRSTTRLAMGTLFTVSTWGVTAHEEENAVSLVFARIKELELLASRQDPSSEVYKINRSGWETPAIVPNELSIVLEKSLDIWKLSHGAFDPGLGSLSDLWGFTQGVPAEPKIPAEKDILSWKAKRENSSEYGIHLEKSSTGMVTIRLANDSFALDLGAIAKGFALDQAMATLKRKGVQNALIIGGGDMVIAGSKGGKPWRIGIQHPRDHDKVMALAEITGDRAMATSGDYERFFMAEGQRYHHILDSQTGKPSRSGLISVSIQAGEAMIADALSTAVFVLGMEKGKALIAQFKDVEGMLVTENGERWKSPGFRGQWLEGP